MEEAREEFDPEDLADISKELKEPADILTADYEQLRAAVSRLSSRVEDIEKKVEQLFDRLGAQVTRY